MALTPQLHPAHRLRAAEIITVAVLAEPPSLTGRLAGVPTGGLGTIPLAIVGPRVRKKKLIATAAFASAHREPNLRRTSLRRKRKRRSGRRAKSEEGRISLKGSGGRKRPGRKRNFKPPAFPHFHSAADSLHDSGAQSAKAGRECHSSGVALPHHKICRG